MTDRRLSPKEMFDVVQSHRPDWSNSKIRRAVEAYNTARSSARATVSTPSLRYLIEWMDPTLESVIRRTE